jgi:hypothetical protein
VHQPQQFLHDTLLSKNARICEQGESLGLRIEVGTPTRVLLIRGAPWYFSALLHLRPKGHVVAVLNLKVAVFASLGEGGGVNDQTLTDEPEDSDARFRTASLHRKFSFRLSTNTVDG